MGSYTTDKFKLLKPDRTDYVDSASVFGNNFINTIDTLMAGMVSWHIDTTDSRLPDTSQVVSNNAKIYQMKSAQIFLSPSKNATPILIPKINNVNAWNNITLAAGSSAFNSSAIDKPQWRYRDSALTIVEFKGKITITTFTLNSDISITASGALPLPTTHKYFFVNPYCNASNPDSNDSIRVTIDNTGKLLAYRTGTTSSTGKYVDLSNLRYVTV